MDPRDDLEYIVNSKAQFNVLRTLREQASPVRKNELESETGSSRSTIDRAINELTDRNWAEETNRNQYIITSAGEAILAKYDEFSGAIAETQTKTKLLNNLGEPIDTPSIEVFANSTTVEYPAKDPLRGWKRASKEVSKRIEDGFETYRGMNPIVSTAGNDIGQQILTEADEAELVIDEKVLDASQTNYSDALEKGLTAGNLNIYISPAEVTITVAIYDEESAEVAVHSENGHLLAGVHGSDEKLVRWAAGVYEQYRQQSYPISEMLQASK